MSQNPLLAPVSDLVDYAAVKPGHIVPAVEELLGIARQAVDAAADPKLAPTWEAVVEPLDTASERLWRAWSVAGHLNAVVNTPELREAYNAALPLVTEFSTWVGLHEGLYKQYQRLAAAPDFASWTPVRRRIVEMALRDFRLSGVELQGADRERYAAISDREAQASQKFSENVLDSIDAWSLLVEDESRLAGIPADVRAAARAAAEEDGKQGWKLTLKMPCYLPVMQYAQDRSLREALYRGYGTVASEQGDAQFDNSPLIEELLALRAEESGLLGLGTFAALRLQTRMARDAREVTVFLRDLAARAKPYAQRDLAELTAYAAAELGLDELQPWDVPYASERLRESRYAYSEDEVKQYFTEPRVLSGLFEVIETLFDVRLAETPVSSWHGDVRGVRVESPDGALIGHLYLDLYARAGKQSGAWVDSERTRRVVAGQVQTPIAYLTCNFSRPNGDRAAVLTHDDVITLFHETGHALHALLSEVDEPGAAAFASVEWDAIELPSQFMENFCWEWAVVQKLSAHVDTGEPLPRALYDRLVAARNYQSGMQTVRQIEFALFDMLMHDRAKGASIGEVLELLQEVRKEVAVLFPPAWHRLPHAFSHLFAGGYGAGYYSYKWAEVLSADAYEAFEEAAARQAGNALGTLDPATGARFRREVLAVGGSRPAADSFAAFRGRAPRIDALLRHSGMTPA
ncbi:Oligopeptidase A [Achromobacter denitrificans]|uniref:M3 family metallopeptidase n=1 Tax=Achromobacter denitrificans TaxID=32002 RepID=UPI00078848B5|nr:M3 family metallopeptidase [Achromobacter denitrificans]OLU05709.1 oligopeptidase A [Achromobacter denitrificans]QKH40765.1 M3 family metallopeptidase [Achromobacter denitrificans]QKH52089.1 M3 family metallopeptidase [Achromobacter denitrificans]CAB3731883.1 Oligopeptidase A [Achromobacter denitrificans]CAB3916917.1 Oligopeptidase A [Achromobacter denitrificans]